MSLLEAAVDAFAQFLGWIDTVFIYDTAISEPLLHVRLPFRLLSFPAWRCLGSGRTRELIDHLLSFFISFSSCRGGFEQQCMRFPELAVSAMTSLAVIASLFTTDEYQHEAKEENCIALCYNIMTEIEAMVGSTDGPGELFRLAARGFGCFAGG